MSAALSRQDYLASRPKKWWHDAIIDDMLASPLDTVKDRAARLGYTPAGLQLILGSDMFKAAYNDRRRQYTELLDATLVHKTAQVASRGLDILLEQMEKKRHDLPFAAVVDAVVGPNGALARLGYGTKGAPSVNVQVNTAGGAAAVIQQVSPEDLAAARARLRQTELAALAGPGRSPASILPGEARGAILPAEGGGAIDSSPKLIEAEVLAPSAQEGGPDA